MKTLKCANTGIVNLDVSKNTELIELDCSNGFIEQLNLANNKKLTHLYCQSNILLKPVSYTHLDVYKRVVMDS
ncbi:hypothetical protein A5875_004653 [Enterococcus sp. 3H8_DIV0648]|nr:hypothetical protein A5875_004653 [Enterococcus sp. 3H8_DIV0648]